MCGALDVNNKFSILTHSYYDLSDSKNRKIDLWKNPDKKIFFDSSTSVLFISKIKNLLNLQFIQILLKIFFEI